MKADIQYTGALATSTQVVTVKQADLKWLPDLSWGKHLSFGAFVPNPNDGPDVFVWLIAPVGQPAPGLGSLHVIVVVANGRVDLADPAKALGPLLGSITVTVERDGETLTQTEDVALHDGTGRLFLFGELRYDPHPKHATRLQADVAKLSPSDRLALLAGLNGVGLYAGSGPGTMPLNPNVGGSAGVVHGELGAVVRAALDGTTPSLAQPAAETVLDALGQLWETPVHYYTADGKPFRARLSGVKVGIAGFEGKLVRTSSAPRKGWDDQHADFSWLEAGRQMFGHPAASFSWECALESLLSRDAARYPGNVWSKQTQRAGGCHLVEAARAADAFDDRAELVEWYRTVALGLRDALHPGTDGQLVPPVAPQHTGAWYHGHPMPWHAKAFCEKLGFLSSDPVSQPSPLFIVWNPAWDDDESADAVIPAFQACAVARKLPKSTFVDALWGNFRAVTFWQLGYGLRGLARAQRVKALRDAVPEAPMMMRAFAVYLMSRGHSPCERFDQKGIVELTPTFHDSYLPGANLVAAGPDTYPWKGTAPWSLVGAVEAMPWLGAALAASVDKLAPQMQQNSDCSRPPDVRCVETWWSVLLRWGLPA